LACVFSTPVTIVKDKRNLMARGTRWLSFQLRRRANKFLRRPLLAVAFCYARWVARQAREDKGGRSALVLTTADPGNLGDEAVFWATARVLKQEQFQRVSIVSFAPDKLWNVPGADTVMLPIHHNPTGLDFIEFVRVARGFSHFYIWGADIVDGSHGVFVARGRLRLANLGAAAGLRTTICSFSVCESPAPEIMREFQRLDSRVALYCRDAVSYERLAKWIGNRAKLSADIAFLLEADSEAPLVQKARAFVQQAREDGKLVVGINLNDMFCVAFGSFPPRELVEHYVHVCLKLRSFYPNLAIVLLPHGTYADQQRYAITDFSLAELFLKRWPGTSNDIFLPPVGMRAVEVRAICGLVDFVFSGRMHLSIACLTQGTPVFGLTYQGKFEGLFRHFGLDEMFIAPDQLPNADAVADFLRRGIERLPALRVRIQDQLPKVKALARENLNLQAP
jgi:polysaccharide pyruvyl transferase WcaK-like protein